MPADINTVLGLIKEVSNGRGRMCFIFGIPIGLFGYCLFKYSNPSGELRAISWALISLSIVLLFFGIYDGFVYFGKKRKDKALEQDKQAKKKALEDVMLNTIKIRDKVKDLETNGRFYIKGEDMFWEIEINPKGIISIKMVSPLCAEEINNEKCMTTINWDCKNLCMYCDKCQKCVSKYSNNICWDSARKTLDNKVDMAKKKLGIK